MAVIQKDIVIPDKLMPDVLSGKIDIMGLAKNANNGKIIKHLSTTDSANNLSDAVAISIWISLIATVSVATIGIRNWVNKKKVKSFKTALGNYIQAIGDKQLTTEIIDELISSLDKLKGKTRNSIRIEFSTDELSALVECLCNHTQTLADANNINIKFVPSKADEEDILIRLRSNLVKQREIFDLAA